MAEGITQEGVFSPDDLFAGDYPVVGRKVTILSGQNVARGSVLGKITASGKFILSDDGAVDGSQTPDVILAEDVDASGGDKEGVVYLSGHFNDAALTFGGAHTAASTRDGLRDKNIYI